MICLLLCYAALPFSLTFSYTFQVHQVFHGEIPGTGISLHFRVEGLMDF
jgi:hypothetical protein